jgi:hypothetical protein
MVASAIGGDFEIFQDSEGIAWGQHWQTRLDEALKEALFLIPILTPSYFNSPACRNELEAFLNLERRSGRQDRILPLYFVDAPVFDDVETIDPLAATLRERQYRKWQSLRILPLSSVRVQRELDSLATEMAGAIHVRQGPAAPVVQPTRSSPPQEAGTSFRDLEAQCCPEMVVIPAGSFVMGSPGSSGAVRFRCWRRAGESAT